MGGFTICFKEYIHKCHLRVNRYLNNQGRYLLDAGSGPIQYPEYLTYSEGYEVRICVDISFLALQEAQTNLAIRVYTSLRHHECAFAGQHC